MNLDMYKHLTEMAKTEDGLRRLMTEGRGHCDAFRKGRLAAQGIGRTEGPYLRGSIAHKAWRAGRDFERRQTRTTTAR